MKILYICHRFPYPPKRGGKIRPFNMIRHLSRTHDVTVVSLARSAEEADDARGIFEYCDDYHVFRVDNKLQTLRMAARLPTFVPSSMGYFYSRRLANFVNALLNEHKFDLIFVHCSSVAQYVKRYSGAAKILDFGDMDSQKWLEYAKFKPFPLSLGYSIEGMKLTAEEKRLAESFDYCTATTRAELETLRSLGVNTPTDWFPNGVDSEFFSPGSEGYDNRTLCFVGRMDYYPNQDCMFEFCAKTWPSVRSAVPDLKLEIVGASPPPAVRRLGEIEGITVTGSVPDVRPFVRRSALMIAPLNIARGTQNKLLEAMAMGVPVLTSNIAAKGVDAIPGVHLLVADTPADQRETILRILDDPAERRRFAEAGRARMLSHHNWDHSMTRLDTIIARCIESVATRSGADGLPKELLS